MRFLLEAVVGLKLCNWEPRTVMHLRGRGACLVDIDMRTRGGFKFAACFDLLSTVHFYLHGAFHVWHPLVLGLFLFSP